MRGNHQAAAAGTPQRSETPARQNRPSVTSKCVGLFSDAPPACTQCATHCRRTGSGTAGSPRQRAAAARVAEQRDRTFAVHESGRAAEDRAEPLGGLAHGDALGAGHVQDRGRRRAQLEAAQRIAVGVSLPDRVEEPHRQIDRLAGEHLARDVDERAVAQIDRVVEPEDQRAQLLLARHELDDPLASEAGLRVLADRRRRVVFSATPDRRPATSG